MTNPLFNLLGNSSNVGNFGNLGKIIQQFQQFKSTFQGNAQQQVQQLLNSGKVSQADYNNAVQLANQLMKMMK